MMVHIDSWRHLYSLYHYGTHMHVRYTNTYCKYGVYNSKYIQHQCIPIFRKGSVFHTTWMTQSDYGYRPMYIYTLLSVKHTYMNNDVTHL